MRGESRCHSHEARSLGARRSGLLTGPCSRVLRLTMVELGPAGPTGGEASMGLGAGLAWAAGRAMPTRAIARRRRPRRAPRSFDGGGDESPNWKPTAAEGPLRIGAAARDPPRRSEQKGGEGRDPGRGI